MPSEVPRNVKAPTAKVPTLTAKHHTPMCLSPLFATTTKSPRRRFRPVRISVPTSKDPKPQSLLDLIPKPAVCSEDDSAGESPNDGAGDVNGSTVDGSEDVDDGKEYCGQASTRGDSVDSTGICNSGEQQQQ